MISLLKLENSLPKKRARYRNSDAHVDTSTRVNPQKKRASRRANYLITALCLTIIMAFAGLVGTTQAQAAGSSYTFKPLASGAAANGTYGLLPNSQYGWVAAPPTTAFTGESKDTVVIEINEVAGFNGAKVGPSTKFQSLGAQNYAMKGLGGTVTGKIDTIDVLIIRVHSVDTAASAASIKDGAYKVDLTNVFGTDAGK